MKHIARLKKAFDFLWGKAAPDGILAHRATLRRGISLTNCERRVTR